MCRRTLVGLLLSCALAFSQTPTPQYDPQADGEDAAIVQEMLTRTWSAEEIYTSTAMQTFVQKEAEQLVAAAPRRAARQERLIEHTQLSTQTGTATPEPM